MGLVGCALFRALFDRFEQAARPQWLPTHPATPLHTEARCCLLLPCLPAPAGRLVDEASFRQRVFVGGLEPEARPLGWKFLLGLFPPNTTWEVGAAAACAFSAYPVLRRLPGGCLGLAPGRALLGGVLGCAAPARWVLHPPARPQERRAAEAAQLAQYRALRRQWTSISKEQAARWVVCLHACRAQHWLAAIA